MNRARGTTPHKDVAPGFGKGSSLTVDEFKAHEKTIERGLKTFSAVGEALLAIREGKAYKLDGYKTFEDYCLRRWKISAREGYRKIQQATVQRNITTAQSTHTLDSAKCDTVSQNTGQIEHESPQKHATQKTHRSSGESIGVKVAAELAKLSEEQQRELAQECDLAAMTFEEIRDAVARRLGGSGTYSESFVTDFTGVSVGAGGGAIDMRNLDEADADTARELAAQVETSIEQLQVGGQTTTAPALSADMVTFENYTKSAIQAMRWLKRQSIVDAQAFLTRHEIIELSDVETQFREWVDELALSL